MTNTKNRTMHYYTYTQIHHWITLMNIFTPFLSWQNISKLPLMRQQAYWVLSINNKKNVQVHKTVTVSLISKKSKGNLHTHKTLFFLSKCALNNRHINVQFFPPIWGPDHGSVVAMLKGLLYTTLLRGKDRTVQLLSCCVGVRLNGDWPLGNWWLQYHGWFILAASALMREINSWLIRNTKRRPAIWTKQTHTLYWPTFHSFLITVHTTAERVICNRIKGKAQHSDISCNT